MPVAQIIYPKRLRYPHKAANHLQASAMVCSLSQHIPVHIYPHIAKHIKMSVAEYIQQEYDFFPSRHLHIHTIPFGSIGVYNFFLDIACLWAAQKPGAVFYTRDIGRAYFALQVARWTRRKIPLFHEVHDFRDEKKLAAVFKKAAGIIFIHEGIEEEARKRFAYQGPSCVAYSGFSPNVFVPKKNHYFIREKDKITLGYVGTIREDKGVDILLETLALLPNEYVLKLVGPVKFKNTQRLQKLLDAIPNSEERVIFTGPVPHNKVPEYLEDVSLIPLPPVSETAFYSQIKIFEALASSIPIVATPHSHLKNILAHEHSAWICGGFSAYDIAQGILALAKNTPLQERIGVNASLVAQAYTWDARAEKIVHFMQTTLTNT